MWYSFWMKGNFLGDLVYDKHSGELVGFVKLGDVNQHVSGGLSAVNLRRVPILSIHVRYLYISP
jgi:hypothetical protein